MLLKWFIIIIVICGTRESEDSEKLNHSSAAEETLKLIIERCYEDDYLSNPTIIFGDFSAALQKTTIVRVDNALNVDEEEKNNRSLNFKAGKVVMIEDSITNLQADLRLLKRSRWWNHMASFFIMSMSRGACENFKDMLMVTWKMDIINSIFICPESIDASKLYTLNPITDYAPSPWKRIEELATLNIYHQYFNPNTSCENIHYEKTKFFNGYEIKITARRSSNKTASSTKYKFFDAISKALNVTYRIEAEGESKIFQHIQNETSDMLYHMWLLESYPEYSFLFPYVWYEIIPIIRTNPEMSTLQKILHLWSTPVLVLAAVCLVIFFLILLMKDGDAVLASLDMIRLLTYVSMRTNVRSHSFRVSFTVMLIFMVISNGVFQGKIAAFLTKQERISVAKTIDELIDLGYKFYTFKYARDLMKSKYPKCDITVVPTSNCIDYVLNGTLNVCLHSLTIYNQNYLQLPVEYVPQPLKTSYLNFKCRHNWPIHHRINKIVMNLFESGLFNFWKMSLSYEQIQKRQANDTEATLSRYRPVKLVKLRFAFELLAIGLSFSTIILLFELFVAKYRNSK